MTVIPDLSSTTSSLVGALDEEKARLAKTDKDLKRIWNLSLYRILNKFCKCIKSFVADREAVVNTSQ